MIQQSAICSLYLIRGTQSVAVKVRLTNRKRENNSDDHLFIEETLENVSNCWHHTT